MKWKYYLSNKLMAGVCILAILFIYFSPISSATTTIYENITTDQYKTIRISSDVCELLHETCTHKWFIDGMPYGVFLDGSFVQVPDNSNVTVALYDPLNTNLQNLPDSKTDYIIIVMTLAQTILPWLVLTIFLYLVWKLQTKNRQRGRR